MKKVFSETIDGSMKDILQLKTLDNSLEYSQMYDALEDTPRDFQTKLIDALNSLAQTMGCSPEEAFNKVLCKSDDGNEDVKKKLYNWWRAFFEVLGKCENVPKVRVSEFNQKIDDLMAEIMKAGDAESTDEEEPVMEESDDEDLGYQQATKEDEDKMLADMDFAIQHLGEVANKVKAVVNFINPYCESEFNEAKNTMKFNKIDERAGGDSDEWVSMDDFVGEEFEESNEEKPMNEAKVVVDANDVWDVLDLLDNDIAKKELTDLINSHLRTEEEIMDAINELSGETITKKELNTLLSGRMSTIVDYLGLDVQQYEDMGNFVDSDKPTSVELESVEDGKTKKVSLYVDWDDDGAGLDSNVVIDVPAEIADSEESTALYDYITDWIDHQDFCVNDWSITDIEGLDSDVELEGTDWKDITEKLTAEELADSIEGWEDSSKKLVVCDAYASGSDIVNVDVLTVTDKRDEVMKMASEYLLGNVENWQVHDASEPRKDENGQFYTELILEPKYDEVSENNDEVKSGEVKDGEKQVTQDGDTKTLVTGSDNSKQKVNEMTIEQEIDDPWKLSEMLWGQGKENLEDLLRADVVDEEYLMQMLEDMEIHNLTSINDAFAFDFPSILDSLGLDGEAWSQNLEIKRKGEYDSDED